MVQPRKTRPGLTERLLMGRKESNQNSGYLWFPVLIISKCMHGLHACLFKYITVAAFHIIEISSPCHNDQLIDKWPVKRIDDSLQKPHLVGMEQSPSLHP